jgi:hypothetical protein
VWLDLSKQNDPYLEPLASKVSQKNCQKVSLVNSPQWKNTLSYFSFKAFCKVKNSTHFTTPTRKTLYNKAFDTRMVGTTLVIHVYPFQFNFLFPLIFELPLKEDI